MNDTTTTTTTNYIMLLQSITVISFFLIFTGGGDVTAWSSAPLVNNNNNNNNYINDSSNGLTLIRRSSPLLPQQSGSSASRQSKYFVRRRCDRSSTNLHLLLLSAKKKDIGSYDEKDDLYTTTTTTTTSSSRNNNNDYNDDAFGFVFLGGAIVANDPIFAGCFLVLSALAAIATRTKNDVKVMNKNNDNNDNNKLPAAVAALTLVISYVLRQLGIFDDDGAFISSVVPTITGEVSPNAQLIELVLCSVSIVYNGFFTSNNYNPLAGTTDNNEQQPLQYTFYNRRNNPLYPSPSLFSSSSRPVDEKIFRTEVTVASSLPSSFSTTTTTRRALSSSSSSSSSVSSSSETKLESPPRRYNANNSNVVAKTTVGLSNKPQQASFQQIPTVLSRAFQYLSIFGSYFLIPVIVSLWETQKVSKVPRDLNEFWEMPISTTATATTAAADTTTTSSSITTAQQFTLLLERLGPTYVKFGQALSSRPDVVEKPLAIALSKLQDQMETDDTSWNRREKVQEFLSEELWTKTKNNRNNNTRSYFRNEDDWLEFINSLSQEPVAAASIGVVYSASIPIYEDGTTTIGTTKATTSSTTNKDYQKVAIKLQRPGIADIVHQDAQLLYWGAQLLEALPSLKQPGRRLIETDMTGAVDEFMTRIIEELDYRNEARNIEMFASLYSSRKERNTYNYDGDIDTEDLYRNSAKGRSKIEVVVPHLYNELCTDTILVMEWIEGTKLADLRRDDQIEPSDTLELIQQGIDCTLSQLLDTGVMHADPHGGNLIKTLVEDNGSTLLDGTKEDGISQSASYRLGYIDFGLLSSIPLEVQDGLVCAVAQLVFAKNVKAVAELFGELQLLPDYVVDDPEEMAALANALEDILSLIIIYDEEDATAPPTLRFDKLLEVMTRLVPRFQFQLPPYFLNNARALGTLEGMARQADPNFNVLRNLYPYAMERLLYNPTQSSVVDATLNSLVESPTTGKVDVLKVMKLIEDISNYSQYSKRRVSRDILLSPNGSKLIRRLAQESAVSAASKMNARRGLNKLVDYMRL